MGYVNTYFLIVSILEFGRYGDTPPRRRHSERNSIHLSPTELDLPMEKMFKHNPKLTDISTAHGKAKVVAPSKSARTKSDGFSDAMRVRLDEYKKAFSFFDANNDGFITVDELEAAMNKCGQFPSKLELKLIMYHGDLDQNGVITFDEFANLMSGTEKMNKYTYNQLKDQFSMFDKDRDGFIEKPEMYECVKELSLQQSFPRSVIEQLFKEADVDGDGKISFEEFVLAVN